MIPICPRCKTVLFVAVTVAIAVLLWGPKGILEALLPGRWD